MQGKGIKQSSSKMNICKTKEIDSVRPLLEEELYLAVAQVVVRIALRRATSA